MYLIDALQLTLSKQNNERTGHQTDGRKGKYVDG